MPRVKLYRGRAFADPRGFYLTPRRVWTEDQLLEVKPWHPWVVWQYLVAHAHWGHRPLEVWRDDGRHVTLRRGQLWTSYRYLAKRAGWRESRMWRFLKRLAQGVERGTCTGSEKAEHRLTLQVEQGETLVTIENYDPYQDLEFYTGTPTRRKMEHVRNTGGTNKNSPPSPSPPQVKTRVTPGGRSTKRSRRGAYPPPPTVRNDAHGRLVASVKQNPAPPETVSWETVRKALKLGIWPGFPAPVRANMLQEASLEGPPPAEVVDLLAAAPVDKPVDSVDNHGPESPEGGDHE